MFQVRFGVVERNSTASIVGKTSFPLDLLLATWANARRRP
jgi:hypothetical protein